MTLDIVSDMQNEKAQAAAWFRELRDQIVAAFEGLEASHDNGPLSAAPPGRFDVNTTTRASDAGSDTRMFWTPGAWWFGGGSDLNPCIEYDEDTAHFHATQQAHLDPHGEDHYPKLKAWADEYFYIPHRHRARGVGGIFMDDRNSGDWAADFELTQDIGRAFLPAYVPLVEKRRVQDWSDADKEAQLVHRGLYAEYNLVYDRGTKFGLATGHDADAVLMSLPPLAKWV